MTQDVAETGYYEENGEHAVYYEVTDYEEFQEVNEGSINTQLDMNRENGGDVVADGKGSWVAADIGPLPVAWVDGTSGCLGCGQFREWTDVWQGMPDKLGRMPDPRTQPQAWE